MSGAKRKFSSLLTRKNQSEDILLQSEVNDDSILKLLKERYSDNFIYTNIGSSAVVYVNPVKQLDINSDSTLRLYTDWANDTSPDKKPLPSHLFSLASSAFRHMQREEEDQCFLLR
jgi:chitin synthase